MIPPMRDDFGNDMYLCQGDHLRRVWFEAKGLRLSDDGKWLCRGCILSAGSSEGPQLQTEIDGGDHDLHRLA